MSKESKEEIYKEFDKIQDDMMKQDTVTDFECQEFFIYLGLALINDKNKTDE